MMLSAEAQLIYDYLTRQVVPTRHVVTYGDVHRVTGVPYGEAGGYMGRVLGEIFNGCDSRQLPPLTCIVVRQEEREAAMPGPGYFRALAASLNAANRRSDAGIERWQQRPAIGEFDPDTSRWAYQEMIQEHQATVWKRTRWPRTL